MKPLSPLELIQEVPPLPPLAMENLFKLSWLDMIPDGI